MAGVHVRQFAPGAGGLDFGEEFGQSTPAGFAPCDEPDISYHHPPGIGCTIASRRTVDFNSIHL